MKAEPEITQAKIKAELEKHDWFGRDAHRTKRVMELAPYLLPARFDTAADYAAALIAAAEQL